ncbi:MAG: hypothetical protein WD874_01855, partial [Parcubacteria group bacterium]
MTNDQVNRNQDSLDINHSSFDHSPENLPDSRQEWISMSEAALLSPYSAQYLSLRARKGRLFSKKIDNTWYTTKEALDAYMKKQMLRTQALEQHVNGNSSHNISSVPLATPPHVVPTVPDEISLKQLRSYLSDLRDHEERISRNSQEDNIAIYRYKENVSSSENKVSAAISPVNISPGKNSWKNISTSRALLIGAMATVLLFSTLQTPLVKGVFDKPLSIVKDKVSEIKGALSFYMNLEKNEILLVNKEGTIAITGHIDTSPSQNGVVPIVADSIVDNSTSTPTSSLNSGSFTLAFVTSNGNITTE